MYEIFEHTADLGLRVTAPSIPELFVEAARGLTSLIVTDLASVRPLVAEVIEVPGTELDFLLFDWLNELLFRFEARRLLFADFQIKLHDQGLTGTARGEPLDRVRHQLEHEVKAITYHGLSVRPVDGRWVAELIVDI